MLQSTKMQPSTKPAATHSSCSQQHPMSMIATFTIPDFNCHLAKLDNLQGKIQWQHHKLADCCYNQNHSIHTTDAEPSNPQNQSQSPATMQPWFSLHHYTHECPTCPPTCPQSAQSLPYTQQPFEYPVKAPYLQLVQDSFPPPCREQLLTTITSPMAAPILSNTSSYHHPSPTAHPPLFLCYSSVKVWVFMLPALWQHELDST